MDFDEHEEQEEEIGMAEAPGYDSLGNSSARSKSGGGGDGAAASVPPASRNNSRAVRYRECLKNHAVNIGGHAVDGCGEFMAAGDEGTLDALKCAACNCHRNFHRKETGGDQSSLYSLQHQHQQLQFYRGPPPAGYLHLTPTPRPLALPSASGGGGYSREEEDVSNPSSSGGGGGSGLKKRFRTKFTQEQKEKMLAFAEQLGWRIQKHDDAALEQFCAETGVKRHVLKVWMHNNKHTLGKKP
ncbi:zinc-finger homeodomain protein 2-like [Tripterygium wilfordii]|uniref:Zinc-finger homeodomain protein 2-like n=1 Tax=Tripterygium wilfordii TaxID=458696 RepID=A0A7J7D1H4_TRIWF|nr:zinc-finger homeodomain protein 2 [Tripterygium wilfordii]KAF5740173.1 zinc-finger homeodomain protein 2-like [Tripterygium wilfordii]